MYSTRNAVLVALAAVMGLESAQAFVSPAALGLREGTVRRSSCRGGARALRAGREDGASEEQVREAYKTYEMLMKNNNFGRGYWMDEKPFFLNIKQAIATNFGGKEDAVAEQAPSEAASSSPFKPLVPLGDLDDEPEEEPKPVETVTVAEPVQAKKPSPEDDEDLKALQEKLASVEAKKKQAEAEAAALKAKLEQD